MNPETQRLILCPWREDDANPISRSGVVTCARYQKSLGDLRVLMGMRQVQ